MLVAKSPTIAGVRGRAQRLIEHEMRKVYGAIPPEIAKLGIDDGHHYLTGDMFLLRTGEGLNFYYKKGQGITIERAGTFNSLDEALWLNGSVYSAVACINGFKPIHASAIWHRGTVFAFTGPSGAGKSTLIAALGSHGFPMFCDDTLVLDISKPDAIVCLPGHKRLKMSDEALQLTEAVREEKVGAGVNKFYAKPTAGVYGDQSPLAELIHLEFGENIAISQLVGAERLVSLRDDHYTTELFDQAQTISREGYFALCARLASNIKMSRFTRPMDVDLFEESVAFIANYIKMHESCEK